MEGYGSIKNSIFRSKPLENHQFTHLQHVYVDSFICEFQNYYYNIENSTRTSRNLIELFYDKLPKKASAQVKL